MNKKLFGIVLVLGLATFFASFVFFGKEPRAEAKMSPSACRLNSNCPITRTTTSSTRGDQSTQPPSL